MKKIISERSMECGFSNVKIGTIDRRNPQVVYLDISTYIMPILDDTDLKTQLKAVERKLNKGVRTITSRSKHFIPKFIIDLNIPQERVKVGRKTFIGFQCFLQQNVDPPHQLKDLSLDDINKILQLFESTFINQDFILSKTKK